MAKFLMTETIHSEKIVTARLGQSGTANVYTDKEAGKAVKLTADSRYELCALGDAVEGVISSVNVGTYDGYSLGGVVGGVTKKSRLTARRLRAPGRSRSELTSWLVR